jgi:4-hydroxybenzoate polyprenyltransferase
VTNRADPAATGRPGALLGAAHIGPVLAVTCVTALLATADALDLPRAVIVTAAVFTGQLTIGWGNDLVDAARDREAGRRDKPVASGEISSRLVIGCLGAATAACITLSFLVGWRSALAHLLLGVGAGHAYNLVAKATAWSWLPYAVAFGALPAVVTLADQAPHWPPAWMMGTAAALGVAAHLLNALPDFDDDAATGVHGLPHRLGPRRARRTATGLLVIGSAVAVLGPGGAPGGWAVAALAVVAGLALVAFGGRGRVPFYAAIAIALVDVSLLTLVSR